jgi:2'-5' RNA ligase
VVDEAPLILTLVLDAASHAVFDDLRRAHFPPERNHLAAHVTLFHALPGIRTGEILRDVRAASARAAFEIEVAGVRPLGGGVAIELRSPTLDALRGELADGWRADLTRQDRAGFRPHVTVQNKVGTAAVAALLTALAQTFTPWTAHAEGLALWRYRGGPWDHVETARFEA